MGNLLPKLGELLKEEYKLQKGVREQVESLRRELESMHAALRKVAEVPRDQLDEQVKLWARDVRELSYDMEDVVDTFLVRVEDGREATNQHWLKRFLEKMSKMGSLFSEGKTRRQIADAIKDINKQAQEVANRRGRYTVDSIVAKPAATSTIDPRLFAMYKNAAQLVGIDGPRDALIKMLSEGDDASKKKMKIVSVVGFGGLGKTTLATAVYHKLKAGFNCHTFVPVGQNPDLKKVLKDILIGLDKQKYTNLNMTVLDERQLIDELREFLENKRYACITNTFRENSLRTEL